MPFSTLPLPLAAALAARGYAEPTAVQAAVVEPDVRGRDLIVSARTGSGKTVAFGLALGVELLDGAEALPRAGAPLALVIAPTRELALQVSRELAWLFADVGAAICTCVGGMDPSRERRALGQGAHIVVGTPGRLRDHLERGALDLAALRFVVLDEADEMLDMGFRDDLEALLDAAPRERRTLLFSATMPRPIAALAQRYQHDALRISTLDERAGHADIAYQAMTVAPGEIEHAVVNLLRFHEAETAMLFCATRDNVRHLHAMLVERGFAAVALSGEHSQNERNQALQALRDGRARVCVATDVAARGIDVASLSLVVHVEVPRDAEVLQHRSGRTGRAGKKGTAVLIVPTPRRRRVEMMLRGARIDAEWASVPSGEMIRAADRDRLLARLLEPIEPGEGDAALAAELVARKSPEELALALVRAHAARLPEPEELTDLTTRAREVGGADKLHHREGFDDVVWFRMDLGRRHGADPRWILPLICRRGHVTRGEIGAIRIAAQETFFQIPRVIAQRFADAAARTADPDGADEAAVLITLSEGTPRDSARANARGGDDRPPRDHVKRDRPAREGPRREHTPRSRADAAPPPIAAPPPPEPGAAPLRRATLVPRPAGPGEAPYRAHPGKAGKAAFKAKGGGKAGPRGSRPGGQSGGRGPRGRG